MKTELSIKQIIVISGMASEIDRLTTMLAAEATEEGTLLMMNLVTENQKEKIFKKIKEKIEEIYSNLCQVGQSEPQITMTTFALQGQHLFKEGEKIETPANH